MKEFKGTKGEWESRLSKIKYDPKTYLILRQDQYQIAKVQSEFIGDGVEFEANAQLIAAAPELLEALQFICDKQEKFLYDGYMEKVDGATHLSAKKYAEDHEWVKKATKAINKALGL